MEDENGEKGRRMGLHLHFHSFLHCVALHCIAHLHTVSSYGVLRYPKVYFVSKKCPLSAQTVVPNGT